jgi:hypothetical protein
MGVASFLGQRVREPKVQADLEYYLDAGSLEARRLGALSHPAYVLLVGLICRDCHEILRRGIRAALTLGGGLDY